VSFCKSPAKEIPRGQQCQEGIGCHQMTCEKLFHSEHFLISRLMWGQNWQICLNIHVERKQTTNLPGLMLPLTSLIMLRVVLLDEGRGRILSMAYRRQKPKVKKSRAIFLLQERNKNTHPAQIGQEDNNNTGCSRVYLGNSQHEVGKTWQSSATDRDIRFDVQMLKSHFDSR
jgi:hypothetical protein